MSNSEILAIDIDTKRIISKCRSTDVETIMFISETTEYNRHGLSGTIWMPQLSSHPAQCTHFSVFQIEHMQFI